MPKLKIKQSESPLIFDILLVLLQLPEDQQEQWKANVFATSKSSSTTTTVLAPTTIYNRISDFPKPKLLPQPKPTAFVRIITVGDQAKKVLPAVETLLAASNVSFEANKSSKPCTVTLILLKSGVGRVARDSQDYINFLKEVKRNTGVTGAKWIVVSRYCDNDKKPWTDYPLPTEEKEKGLFDSFEVFKLYYYPLSNPKPGNQIVNNKLKAAVGKLNSN